jgi:hypothetical protein
MAFSLQTMVITPEVSDSRFGNLVGSQGKKLST